MKMNSNPFFSVIIPCYNVSTFIDKTLHSMESQTFSNFEVLLIDDCSSDDTYNHCEHYAGNSSLNIRIFRNAINCGPGMSRNIGINQAQGSFISFCDSDDWYQEDFLQLTHEMILKSSSDIIFLDHFRSFSTHNKVRVNSLNRLLKGNSREDHVALCTDSLWSIIVKKELFQHVQVPHLYNAEDVVTVPLLVCKAKNIAILNEPLYNYTYRISSLSTLPTQRAVDNFLEADKYLNTHKDSRYEDAFEFHCIKLVLYGAVYNVVKLNKPISFVSKQCTHFAKQHPLWFHNKYIRFLPFRKRAWLFCIRYKLFPLLYAYVNVQGLYFKFSKLFNKGS